MYGESSSNTNLLMLMQTVGVPLLVVLLGAALWWLLRQRLSRPLLIMAPALGLGFWISYSWIQGRLGLPPQQALDVLIPVLLIALLLELGLPRLGLSRLGQTWLSLPLLLGMMVWMLYPILSRAATAETVTTLLAIALFYLLLQSGFSHSTNARVQNALALCCAAAAAPVMAIDGTLLLAQLSGALATGLGVLWLLGLLVKSEHFNLPLLTPMMLVGLYVGAQQYAEINLYALLLVSLGTLASTVIIRRWWPIASLWGDNLRVLVLGALPFALALWLIWPEQSLY